MFESTALMNNKLKWVSAAGVAALIIFIAGFVPMWIKARGCNAQLQETRHELGLLRLQNEVASAAIDARRGDYERARKQASQFFTELRVESDRGEISALTAAEREKLAPLFVQRDNLITLLARSDPACADRLSDLYVAYRKATSP